MAGDDKQRFGWFDRTVVPVLGWMAALVLFLLMLLTCADVVGRYFFNRPVRGAFELTEVLLAALIFSGLPLVTLRNDHVTVDLLDPIVPDWVFNIQHVVACAIGFICTAYLSWRLWLRAEQTQAAGQTTAEIKIQLGWLTYSMSAAVALTAVALLVLAFRRPQRHFSDQSGT